MSAQDGRWRNVGSRPSADGTAGLVLIDTQAGTEDPEKALQYDLMHEVWVGSGPNDQLLAMVAAIIIGNQRPESAEWIDARHIVKVIPLTQPATDGNNGPPANGPQG